MPGHAAHAARRRVIHSAPKQVIIIGILARIGSGFVVMCFGGDARQKTRAPWTCRTSDRRPLFWRGGPCNRSSSHRVWTACFGWGKIAGVFHAKRRKYVLLNVDIFCLAGDFLNQRAKQNEVDVGIAENLTGTRLQRRGERTTNAFCFIGSSQSPRICEIYVSRFARSVS